MIKERPAAVLPAARSVILEDCRDLRLSGESVTLSGLSVFLVGDTIVPICRQRFGGVAGTARADFSGLVGENVNVVTHRGNPTSDAAGGHALIRGAGGGVLSCSFSAKLVRGRFVGTRPEYPIDPAPGALTC